MEWIIIWVIGCLFIGWMASGTSLGFISGFLLSLILSPFVGFIIVLFYPEKKRTVNHINKISTPTDINIINEKLQKLDDMKKNNTISESEYKLLRNQVLNNG